MFINSKVNISNKKHLFFIKLSKDINDIHLKKKNQYPVVHGLNQMIICLDKILKKLNEKYISNIKIIFHKPIIVPSLMIMVCKKKNDQILCELKYENEIYTSFDIKLTSVENKNNNFPNKIYLNNNKIINIKYFESTKKKFKLIKKQFPNLSKNIGEKKIIILMKISMILGTIYPGKNSLISSLNLEFLNSNKNLINFKIKNFDKRLNLSEINFKGCGIELTAKSFHKPKKTPNYNLKQLKNIIKNNKIICKNLKLF